MQTPSHQQVEKAEDVWAKAWKFFIQPLLAVIVSGACFYITSSMSEMRADSTAVRALVDKQGETLIDINGKVNYGVIQRIDSLERSQGEMATRISELERKSFSK